MVWVEERGLAYGSAQVGLRRPSPGKTMVSLRSFSGPRGFLPLAEAESRILKAASSLPEEASGWETGTQRES